MRQTVVISFVVCVLIAATSVQARYLPTRSQDDRLARLRELLKDLLEVEVVEDKSNILDDDQSNGEMYMKRNVAPSLMSQSRHLIRPL